VPTRYHDRDTEERPRSQAAREPGGPPPALRYVDQLRKPGRTAGAAGPGPKRAVLVTDGPFAETREHVG